MTIKNIWRDQDEALQLAQLKLYKFTGKQNGKMFELSALYTPTSDNTIWVRKGVLDEFLETGQFIFTGQETEEYEGGFTSSCYELAVIV